MNRSGAPHSSSVMWACSEQMTPCHGRVTTADSGAPIRRAEVRAMANSGGISRLAVALESLGALDRPALKRFWSDAHAVVEEAWNAATHDGYPPAKALLSRVYSGTMARKT